MNLTRIRTLLALAITATAVSAAVVDLATGRLWTAVHVPWTVPGALAIVAAAILMAAWPVRQYVKGKRRRVDPIRAATTLVFAKACALSGAVLAGVYLGIALVSATVLHSPLAWTRLWQALAAFAAAAILAVAGRAAEWFCRLPPEDSGPEDSAVQPA
ncbi:MAG: DUF3180 domain-containing protein [Bifidobacteriaceae bacterium]|jgi:hypothetical protein|nr:DUF3180 domain-containing protein [Bifidobacteriaceae bacterium]